QPSGSETVEVGLAARPIMRDNCTMGSGTVTAARLLATVALVWAGLVFQPATTAGSRAINQLNRAVTRPLPALPAPKVVPSDRVWVPDRYVAGSDGLVHAPGHWERRINDQEVHAPPVVACSVGTGLCVLVPGGIRPEPEARPGL
ncbi:MAG: hypothetical protein ACREJV_13440, partial [Candidatus Rokuibacteriota bacterium]